MPGLGFSKAANFFPAFLLIFFIYCLFSPSYYRKKGLDHFALYSKITGVLLVLFVICMAALFHPPVASRAQRQLTTCKGNLKNIGISLEIYSYDNKGIYPLRLEDIVPARLKSLPTCPAARKHTYVYLHNDNPEIYTVYCSGGFHKNVDTLENFPQYDSVNGLIEGR